MLANPDDFIPFLATTADVSGEEGIMDPAQFETYVKSVRSTAEWGGHLEILALSHAYKLPITVVQIGSPMVEMGEHLAEGAEDKKIRIVYHRKMVSSRVIQEGTKHC